MTSSPENTQMAWVCKHAPCSYTPYTKYGLGYNGANFNVEGDLFLTFILSFPLFVLHQKYFETMHNVNYFN